MRTGNSQQFDELEWLNNYFDDQQEPINRDEIDSVLYFALIWNAFESFVCERNASVPIIERKVNVAHCNNLLGFEVFAEYLEYFQNRYLSDGQINPVFSRLKFRPNDRQEFVEQVLQGEKDDVKDVVLALLIVVYRLRNNLFHGEKRVYKLNYQVDNFKIANRILATFLDALKAQ